MFKCIEKFLLHKIIKTTCGPTQTDKDGRIFVTVIVKENKFWKKIYKLYILPKIIFEYMFKK